ncbi:tetratricopeptide repeat protein [Pseudoalteromonas fenneropenaei]|uniref:Tetratricopeptide repeat protein n=1 Tax=Pseudoalteromonas fenneropenaei TaxID=1737459 RepID=A0ABV7CQ41_9GAMM
MWLQKTKVLALIGALLFTNVSFATLEQGIIAANEGRFEDALKEFRYLADMGYAPGIYELAKMYEGGFGVTKNERKAAELFKQAVDLNLADAMFSLAVMYKDGRGVKQDLQKAVELFTSAANKDLPAAQFNLGVMYTNGEGVIKDYRAALNWYEKAAGNNFTLAQFNMALMYFQGLGVPESVEKSYIWNLIAEWNGNRDAMKSRQLDEQKMSPSEVEEANRKANVIYERILAGTYIAETRPES